jgi:hypothetical protein
LQVSLLCLSIITSVRPWPPTLPCLPQDGLPIPHNVERCPICGRSAPDEDEADNSLARPNMPKPRADQWECGTCHFFCKMQDMYCEMCGTVKP